MNKLQVQPVGKLANQPQHNPEAIALLKQTYAKGLSDLEFELFMAQAKSQNLNPFNKEIYAMVVGGKLVIMNSIGGLRKVAHASNSYLGCKRTAQYNKESKLISGTAVVKKLVQNRVAEFECTVLFDEYAGNTPPWKDMPESQLLKCAEAGALRMAFPSVDQMFEAAEVTGRGHPELDVDYTPEPEFDSQETDIDQATRAAAEAAGEFNTPAADDPGKFLLKLKKNGPVAKRIMDIPVEDLREFISWAYTQEAPGKVVQVGLEKVEAYFKQKGL